MTGPIPHHYRAHLHAVSHRRLGLALCASLLAHASLLTAVPGSKAARAPTVAAQSVLNARIAVASTALMESVLRDPIAGSRIQPARDDGAARELAARAAPAEAARAVAGAGPKPSGTLETAGSIASPPRLPAAVDTTWYGAQDIDAYPRSAVPLRLAPPPAAGVARLLLWLRIDEHGEVVEVSAGEPAIPTAWVDAARTSLAAIRFTPARKDERAVRSRLLLSVSFAADDARD